MYTYEFPHPSMASDLIVIREGVTPDEDKILLIKRGGDPHKGMYALAGGFVEIDELPLFAAKRELKEETNIDVELDEINFWKLADKVDRDSRGRTYSCVYDIYITDEQAKLARPGDDAADLEWHPIKDIIEHKIPLAFDHQEILDEYFTNAGYSSAD